MRKGPSERKVIENVLVTDIAEGGKGVGKTNDLVIFIDKAVPGDVVDVEIYRKKKNFAEAKIKNLIKASEHRIEAFCQHFGVCGGCKWQHMTYESQLFYKQKSVTDALQRLGKVDTSMTEPILSSAETRFYRNKLEFTFSNKRWLTSTDIQDQAQEEMQALGFHIPLRFDKILDIETCYLQASPSNEIRNKVREFTLREGMSYYDLRNHEGALRNLVIRTSSTGETMVIVIFAYADEEQRSLLMNFLKTEFPQVNSLLYIINHKLNDTFFDQDIHVFAGRDHIFEEMPDTSGGAPLKFKIGSKSFYQTNSAQAYELYRIGKQYADFKGDELVYDLYTGAGTIANFIARNVKKVVGIEYVEDAIIDARINSEINDIHNTVFFAGDMKDVLTPAFVEQQGKPDVIIADPPRAGMHPDVVQRLLEIEAPKIVYISCNAATQARDISMLSEKYEVTRIRPVDMFPHTQHVENVALLIRRTI
ncbi:MAG TPA: 23S rRNA (uracil(1939)-C(5))-methyltransferase RlmD [Sphingobacteriaceae bacterium]|nr:23S rRNA (uracil(1939)-C(5))-methyltransferase RlmD [Sphingobacteriaceae bacterium]